MIDSGYSYFNISDNKITVTTTISFRGFVSDYIKCKSNTNYKVSYKTEQTGITFETNYAFYDENKIFIVRNNTGLSPANAEYIRVNPISYSSTTIDYYDIQLEESSTATAYIEHKEQTFTFPLGNEKLMLGDYLADDGIHHVRGQVDLSTLTWSVNSFPNQNNTLCLSGSYNQSKSKQGQNTLLCNRFKEQIQYNVDNEGIDCYTNGYGFTLRILKSRLSEQTAMGVKTWLQANLSIVEYELEQEEITPYTSAQQEVYNAIKQALSYEEQTNISSNTIALFDIVALRNMNDTLNTLENEIELLP